LTPTTEASGPHDFAVRRRAVRRRAWAIAHGSIRPALRSHLRAGTAASTAPRPNVRDDGQRPSFGTGWQSYSLTSISEKQKYFLPRDWTGQITLIRFNKLDFSRNAQRARLGRAALPVRANQTYGQFNKLHDAGRSIDEREVTLGPGKLVYRSDDGNVVGALGTGAMNDLANPINVTRLLCAKSEGNCEMSGAEFDMEHGMLISHPPQSMKSRLGR
jgi:hypothetical protein